MMGKVIHGLDMFHIALLTNDDQSAVTYEQPEPIIGAVNVSVNPTTERNSFYADNMLYAVLDSNGDIDMDMEAADLPFDLQKKIFGHKEKGGVQFANVDDIAAELAVGFRAKTSGGGYRFYWFLKGKSELVPIEHQTDEGNVTPQTAKLKIKFMPLQYNKNWKAQAESAEIGNLDWFKEVIYDESQIDTP